MTPGSIDYQIMWNRMIAVVEEQATTLIRTAFSTSVREAGDLSAGLFNKQGRMMVQAVTGTPGHVNAMAESVGHFIREIGGQNIFDGDVYLTNDPWMGTGHLHDFTVVTPVFRKGDHIGFFACTAHVVDIGGRGFGPDGNDVYEEGLLVPIMKFAEKGAVSHDLMRIVRGNVREPDQVTGDLHSLAACNQAGNRRLQEMLDEFRIDDLAGLSDFIIDASRKATRKAIGRVPPGAYRNSMTVDGYDDPVDLVVEVTVNGDRLKADFAGTSGMSRWGVNVPEVYTRAYACYGLKCAIAPDVPNNAGSLEPFEITAPEGCILAARRPAPVSVRHVIGHLIPDVVLGALHQALPDTVPAEGASALWNIQISARASDPDNGLPNREVLMFNSGGAGARPTLDGLSATAFPSGVKTMSVEVTEHVGPIVIWRKDLREGSGGAGVFRGGLGQTIEIEPREGYDFWFNAMFDRIDYPARGRDGGVAGAAGKIELGDGTKLRGKGRQFVGNGSRLRLSLPGGADTAIRDAATATGSVPIWRRDTSRRNRRKANTGWKTDGDHMNDTRIALVTGAAQGIGFACAEALAEDGYRLALADIDAAGGEAAARKLGQDAVFYACDMGDPAQVEGLFDRIEAELGPVCVLVNNAGIAISADFLDVSLADFRKVIDINLTGTFLAMQRAAKTMVARKIEGAIVNMSSINAILSIPTIASYSASKGGVMQLTKAASLALAPYNIRVNAVGPGSIDTAMMAGVNANEEAMKKAMSRTPLKRMGTPREVADIVAFLASSKASYVTGETIYVDGGRLGLNYTC